MSHARNTNKQVLATENKQSSRIVVNKSSNMRQTTCDGIKMSLNEATGTVNI